MERVLNYFTGLYPNHLAAAGTDHYSHLLAAAKTMSSACSSIEAEAQRLKVGSSGGAAARADLGVGWRRLDVICGVGRVDGAILTIFKIIIFVL